MTPTRIRNPFKPGRGATPPYLAGRENEQNRLREILADMADGDSPAADIVMYGPRGMGKTVLLNWFANEVEDADALEDIVEDSQHYPYFIQLWGATLWDLAKENNLQSLSSEEVVGAKPVIESHRITFYKERRDTLEKKKLLPVSVAIATLFQQTETITKDRLIDIIVDNFSDDPIARDLANDHLLTLIRHEFVWAPPGTDLYEVAIPSLMTYVLDKQREHVQKNGSSPLL